MDYNNLCANLNYLKDYAQKNFDKNRESFIEFSEKIDCKKPSIFSFGCGLGLDSISAKEVFGDNVKYFGIDECDWAIKKTSSYKNFVPRLPDTMKFEEGLFLLTATNNDAMICFFNSLFTISNNTNLMEKLITALQNKNNFYIVCDYTINSNFHMPKVEKQFIRRLKNTLRGNFHFKSFEIIGGDGIIVMGERN